MHQTWQISQRLYALSLEAVKSMEVHKVSKIKKKTDVIKSKLYCPLQQPLHFQSIITNLTTKLQYSNSQFKTLLPLSFDNIETLKSIVGFVPKGPILSYQQKNGKSKQTQQLSTVAHMQIIQIMTILLWCKNFKLF